MRRKNLLTVLAVGVLVFALSSQALAFWGQGPKKEEKPPRGEAFEKICDRLDLTDEQKAKFKASSEALKKEQEANKETMKKLHEDLKAEMQKDTPNRATLHGLIRKISQEQTEMHIKHMDSLLDLRDSLTPEQKEKFEKMLKNRKDRPGFGGREKGPRR